MAKISTGLTLTTDYFMRNFYQNNRDAGKRTGRSSYSKLELSYEDSRALSRASKRMLSTDYGTEKEEAQSGVEDIDETMISKIKAFADTYNNALESGSTDDYNTKRCLKQLKALGKKHAEELSEIGINVESSGKLTIDESLLKMADSSQIRKVFSDENDFSRKSLSLAKQLNSFVHDNLLAEINGNGLKINIKL